MFKKLTVFSSFVLAAALPAVASAHEVYVLSPEQIAAGISTPSFDMVGYAIANLGEFTFWGFIAALTVFFVFFISIIRAFERALDPMLLKMKLYAPAVARVTVGLGFLCGSYFQASFGPELPLSGGYGAAAPFIALVLAILGTLIIAGYWVRGAAIVALLLYTYSWYLHGSYMLTYANYLGEFIVLIILGAHHFSVHKLIYKKRDTLHRSLQRFARKMEPLAFPILRVCFGISLIYASAYAKILHNNLALQVASLPLAGHPYPLAHYLGFEPHFLVLGAAIIEIVVGMFFVLGIEIRFTSLFLLFWLSLSLWFFGESVWPHIILIGIPIAFIMHGYDEYSLEGRFFDKGRREPVL